MKIGSARVSDKQQNLDRQIAALKKAGCKKIFCEKQSGKSTHNWPELEKAIQSLEPTDVLILAE
jgi:DNA invertase Pin-like site-specific DNA recombinase